MDLFVGKTSQIIFVTGYKRVGKDTFYDFLSGKIDSGKQYSYNVYCNPEQKSSVNILRKYMNNEISRFAFADELKREVLQRFDVSVTDSNKDQEISNNFLRSEKLKTNRDLLKFWGSFRKNSNANYWSQCVLDKIRSKNPSYPLITDWRYLDEYLYFREMNPQTQIVTIRLFRADNPIPPKADISEHDLDDFETDVLLVPSEKDFDIATEIFPFMRNYQLSGIMRDC